jgi:hypothetical protein
MFVHRVSEIVGDVFREFLGDGDPFALAGFDFFAEFLAAHAERPCENADGIGEVFLNDGFRGVAGEDIAAQSVDPAALFGGFEVIPSGFRAGFLIGEAETGELGIG